MRRNNPLDEANPHSRWIVLGKVSGLFGVHGWVRLFSYTQDRAGIIDYDPLYIESDDDWQTVRIQDARLHGKGLVARLAGYDDRDAAAALVGRSLAVRREQLPAAAPGEYYWTDLIGLRVINQDDVVFGTVDYLFETGANDVLVIKGERERLLPFIEGKVINEIDLDRGVIRVDWDPGF
jgi:16S rRNA processing protein RimM